MLLKHIFYSIDAMIRVGKIVATHGLGGNLVMTHIVGDHKWITKGMALMVEMQKGSLIPYFITDFKSVNKEECNIQIEDILTIEQARRLVAKSVFVEPNLLTAYAKESPLLWIGFTMTDGALGVLGTVEDVMQTGNQWLGKIIYQGKEVLIPLVNPILKSVNLKNKLIIVSLPEGLLEVYLD